MPTVLAISLAAHGSAAAVADGTPGTATQRDRGDAADGGGGEHGDAGRDARVWESDCSWTNSLRLRTLAGPQTRCESAAH